MTNFQIVIDSVFERTISEYEIEQEMIEAGHTCFDENEEACLECLLTQLDD